MIYCVSLKAAGLAAAMALSVQFLWNGKMSIGGWEEPAGNALRAFLTAAGNPAAW